MELKRKEAEAIEIQEQHQLKEDDINTRLKECKLKQIEIMARMKEIKQKEESLEDQQTDQTLKEKQLREMESSILQRERDTKATLHQQTEALSNEKEQLELERQRWYNEWRQKESKIKETQDQWNQKTDKVHEMERNLKVKEEGLNKKMAELRKAENEIVLKKDEIERNEENLHEERNRLHTKEKLLTSHEEELDIREKDIGSVEHGRRRLADDVARFESEQKQREKDYMLRIEELDTKFDELEKREHVLSNVQMKQRQRELLIQKRENYVHEEEQETLLNISKETVTRTSSDSGLTATEEPLMSEYTIVQRGDDQNSPRRFQPFNIKISPGLTIWGLKTILDKEEGIPTHWQRFYYGGIQLDDTTTLSESSIPSESSIYLRLDVPEGSTTIILKTGQRTRMIDVDLNETVAVTKARIYKYEGVPPHQQILLHRDIVMDDGNLLHDFNLHKNSAISMKLNYRIWVRTKTNTLIPLEVDELSTIRNVKFLLREAAGVCVDSQKLGFRGKFLDDSRSLIHYKICEGSTIDLTCSVIIAQKPAGENLKMELDPCVTVRQLKEEIRRIKSIPVIRQALVVRDQHLNDNDMVMDHLKKGSVINLHSGNVMIVSSSGKVILSDVQPWHTVMKVKEMIERKTGVSAQMQHLEYQGSPLVSGSLRLSDFDIKNGSVLQMKPIEIS
ncbi:polyubiquitin-like [Anneissia japonica]|uniref:polyubiquitin-like n=1 Tax=Anneissia japonica TaxID=1529436 RepID=UPI001425500B|nr:polyubiquitin-like [Anneissia japonica]